MRFKDLGKTHRLRLPIFHVRIRIIYWVVFFVAFVTALLARAIWPEGPSYGFHWLASVGLLALLAKCCEVPFTRELLINPLFGQVCLDP